MDDKLSWGIHVDIICSRVQQRLYFLRRRRIFGVEQTIVYLFYQAVESIIRYALRYGLVTSQFK